MQTRREIAKVLNTGNWGIRFLSLTVMETQIKESLNSLLTAIKAANGQTVAAEMERLDELLERGRAELHPQLVHFLQNRSYAKALMFLGGEANIPVGVCGGRATKG